MFYFYAQMITLFYLNLFSNDTSIKANWVIKGLSGDSVQSNVTIPKSIHSILLDNKVINDTQQRTNEKLLNWIPQETWSFENNFSINIEDGIKYFLNLDSVDTLADIYINDNLVSTIQNQFRGQSIDINPQIKQGINSIRIILLPVLNQTRTKFSKDNFSLMWSEYPIQSNWANNNGRVYVRKTQSDFGWDWGPTFIPQGLMGDVFIHQVNSNSNKGNGKIDKSTRVDKIENSNQVNISDWLIHQNIDESLNLVSAQLKLDILEAGDNYNNFDLTYTIEQGDIVINKIIEKTLSINLSSGLNTIDSFSIKQPLLWWPRDMGPSNLYTITVSIPSINYNKTKTYGFRKATIVDEPMTCLDTKTDPLLCRSFQFKINDVPFFTKGSNMIPLDTLRDRITFSNFKYLLDMAISANFNMLRVWGGGQYLPTEFYSQADSAGIMIWQEFMFACGMQPSDDQSFLDEIVEEVRQQVVRLNHHPSIFLYGGNNENLTAINSGWYGRDKQTQITKYETLMNKVWQTLSKYKSQSTQYVDSSPSNNLINENQFKRNYDNQNTEEIGDNHYYNQDKDCLSENQPQARFISEHGFITMPAWVELKSVQNSADFDINSQVSMMRLKQDQPPQNGQQQAMFPFHTQMDIDAMRYAFGEDQARINAKCKHWTEVRDFNIRSYSQNVSNNDPECEQQMRKFISLVQMGQGLCYNYGFKYWRKLQQTPRKTMGILQWQLSDTWQGPSCSAVEYSLRPRPGWYQIKNAFRPVITRMEQEKDSSSGLTNIMQRLIIDNQQLVTTSDQTWTANFTLQNFDKDMKLKSNQNKVKQFKFSDNNTIIFNEKDDYRKIVLTTRISNISSQTFDFARVEIFDAGKKQVQIDNQLIGKPNMYKLNKSEVKIKSMEIIDSNEIEMTLLSTGFSYLVLVESEDVGEFDNMQFSLVDDEEITVKFKLKETHENDVIFQVSCQNCPFNEQRLVRNNTKLK